LIDLNKLDWNHQGDLTNDTFGKKGSNEWDRLYVYNPILDTGVYEFNFTIQITDPSYSSGIVFGIFDADNTDSSQNYFTNSAVSFCCKKGNFTLKPYNSCTD